MNVARGKRRRKGRHNLLASGGPGRAHLFVCNSQKAGARTDAKTGPFHFDADPVKRSLSIRRLEGRLIGDVTEKVIAFLILQYAADSLRDVVAIAQEESPSLSGQVVQAALGLHQQIAALGQSTANICSAEKGCIICRGETVILESADVYRVNNHRRTVGCINYPAHHLHRSQVGVRSEKPKPFRKQDDGFAAWKISKPVHYQGDRTQGTGGKRLAARTRGRLLDLLELCGPQAGVPRKAATNWSEGPETAAGHKIEPHALYGCVEHPLVGCELLQSPHAGASPDDRNKIAGVHLFIDEIFQR